MSTATTLWVFLLGVASGVTCIGLAVVAVLQARRMQADLAERLAGLPTVEQLREAEGRLRAVESELQSLHAQEGEARQTIAAANAARAELAECRAQLATLEPKRAELALMESRLVEARAALERAEQQLGALRTAIAGLVADEEARHARLSQLESQIRDAVQRLDGVQAELAGLMAARTEATQQVAALKAEIGGLAANRDSLQREIGVLQGRVAQLEEVVRQLERRAADAKAAQEEAERRRSAARTEVEELERTKKELEADVRHAERNLDSIRKTAAELAPATSADVRLEAVFKNPPLPDAGKPGEMSEAEALKKVEEHAKKLGFVYSRRVIRAFHTSLKIDSKAPLMVLAGISGTGKTQLPRLYADALGIHFLPVSVQPGWDSPQDLLGFFSHLEGRFRPTALLQALVQMDRFVGSDALKGAELRKLAALWKESDRSDEVLLVLLDEMNLARVEYYFSDFLSKLELRNSQGFREDDPESRRRASVFLEGGPGAEGIPVLPGHNVLFVGTMNEDETTQSLSDKVVDRANVLRFGTPRKLESGAIAAKSRVDGVPRLARTSWDSWKSRTAAQPTVAGRALGEWIERLNGALGRVHRPFGHRTAGAIAEYVRQYPAGKSASDGVQAALADQVEQRVMPKLRGIDPQTEEGRSTIADIKAVVREIGDEALAEAIDRGEAAHGGNQFAWFGVDRGAE